jgi:L-seryl-tRNA(Ser) seleniumtransferase
VHRSNFAIVGFTEEASEAELAKLAHSRGTLLLHDLGSGALDPALGDATAAQSLKDGADLVLVSGDKLLGGPQAGILLGRRALIERCKKHPLSRALRVDKMLLAALEGTLRVYRSGRGAELPALAALQAPADELSRRATRLALELQQRGIAAAVVACEGQVGGGSLPLVRLPGFGVALDGPPAELLAALRGGVPAVMAIVRDGRVVLDVRCVADLAELGAAAAAAVGCADGKEGATLRGDGTEV